MTMPFRGQPGWAESLRYQACRFLQLSHFFPLSFGILFLSQLVKLLLLLQGGLLNLPEPLEIGVCRGMPTLF